MKHTCKVQVVYPFCTEMANWRVVGMDSYVVLPYTKDWQSRLLDWNCFDFYGMQLSVPIPHVESSNIFMYYITSAVDIASFSIVTLGWHKAL
jgi:hypothetical protein